MDRSQMAIVPIDTRKMLVIICLMVAMEAPLRLISWHEGSSQLLFIGVWRLIEAAVIIGVTFAGKNGLSVLGLSAGTALSGFGRGLLWSLGFGGVVLLVFILLRLMGIDALRFINPSLPVNTGHLMLFFLVGGVIAPVTEELFFRGVVYGFLRRWGAALAIMVSSLVFVLAHMDFIGFPYIQVTGGVLFAVAYEIEKNLMVPITLHMAGNLAIFSVPFL